MRIVKPLLFVVALLFLVEATFRIYLFGVNSLNPMQMNSYTQIHDSGITQAASTPDVFYELRPNYAGWYKGTRFVTNSVGLRDKEYSLSKADDVFRVAVLGSSWTMGSGVEAEEIWHSVMEARLNSDTPNGNFEFLNFSVDQYGLAEIVATLEQKVPDYDPDLVLIALTHYTPTVKWPDPPVAYQESPRRHPFFDSYTLRVLDLTLGLGLFPDSDTRREGVEDPEAFTEQVERFIARTKAFSETTGTPVAILKLAYARKWSRKGEDRASLLDSPDHEFAYIDITEEMLESGYSPGQLRISNWDSHPNRLAHELMADTIRQALIEERLLPAASSGAIDR